VDLEVWHLIVVFEWLFDLEEKVDINKFNRLESSVQGTSISLYAMVSKTKTGSIICTIITA